MSSEQRVDIFIVVPVYKEEANIRPFLARMEPVLEALTPRHEILFCLDPSPDRTEAVVQEEVQRNPPHQARRLLAAVRAAGGDDGRDRALVRRDIHVNVTAVF